MLGLQPSESPLCDLANQLCARGTPGLPNNINIVFKAVTCDLQPLLPAAVPAANSVPDEVIISVADYEHNTMWPDNVPNWILRDLYTFSLVQ